MIDHNLVSQFFDKISDLDHMHAKFIEKSINMLNSEELEKFSSLLKYYRQIGLTIDELVDSYMQVVNQSREGLLHLQTYGTYRYSRYEEVANKVYHNKEYMEKYMVGVAITLYTWPSHIDIRRFYIEALPLNKFGPFLEIGPGHGMYFMEAMRRCSFSEYIGVDISQTSASMTRNIIESSYWGSFSNYQIIVADYLSADFDKKFDAVIVGEVLEHVENPMSFLHKTKLLASPNAFIFISTCVNAPDIDHIYHFRHTDEVNDLFESAGFKVNKSLLIPYMDQSIETCIKRQLPINVAYCLEPPNE